ncbi:hypothetical protein TRFO_04700 [Tritrichomonas foetus]|uniref:Uncharacterized protein n=1 Tax=Tritrichomonas foetus TaxID=1144522 RepID=A0A1J4KH00_9EUKA|nr:hypothetical protein TRFO_04700 [Tritrichomonas foetus]|eukprot:OHT09100.1 hypothetical protein TRFO_04700 [Tritrichomonas foetus]
MQKFPNQPNSNEVQRAKPPLPMINNQPMPYNYGMMQQPPQAKFNPPPQQKRRKNHAANKIPCPQYTAPMQPQQFQQYPQPYPENIQPINPMITLPMNSKFQEWPIERRRLFTELFKNIPNQQMINELIPRLSDQDFRYFMDPHTPAIFDKVKTIPPTYILLNYLGRPSIEFNPTKDKLMSPCFYLGFFMIHPFLPDKETQKGYAIFVNNKPMAPFLYGEIEDSLVSPFFKLDPNDGSQMWNIAFNYPKRPHFFFVWLVIIPVSPKKPEDFISEFYAPKHKFLNPIPKVLTAKCFACRSTFDAFGKLIETMNQGDCICNNCRKRIPLNQFIFEAPTEEDSNKRKCRTMMFDMIFPGSFMKYENETQKFLFPPSLFSSSSSFQSNFSNQSQMSAYNNNNNNNAMNNMNMNNQINYSMSNQINGSMNLNNGNDSITTDLGENDQQNALKGNGDSVETMNNLFTGSIDNHFKMMKDVFNNYDFQYF